MFRAIILILFFYKRKCLSWLKREHIKYNGFSVIFAFPQSKISIGAGTTINSGFFSNLIGLYQRMIIVARHGGNVKIGERCGLSGSTIYAMSSVEIGDETLVGGNVKIIDNDFHPLEAEKRIQNAASDIKKAPIKIGKRCFIGANSIILKGSEIGDNCVVGAGAVVAGKFPAHCIIAGNPARVIKENHDY